jgi:rhamnulose-1-phosphate aldolase
MKNIPEAPFMVEMIRTTTNMYDHGWDERNGGNISLMLDEKEVAEYLDTNKVLRTIPTGFTAPALEGKVFLVTGT